MSSALLLVDIQNDYFPGGAKALPGSVAAGERAAALLAGARDRGLPVVHVQHVAIRPAATFFLPDTPGVQLHAGVAPRLDEPVFVKHFPSAFRETDLREHLREQGIERLLIAGMMTQMCIDTTTRAAADLGFDCVLAHDACAASPLAFAGRALDAADVHAAFVAALDGTFARALSVEEICRSL